MPVASDWLGPESIAAGLPRLFAAILRAVCKPTCMALAVMIGPSVCAPDGVTGAVLCDLLLLL